MRQKMCVCVCVTTFEGMPVPWSPLKRCSNHMANTSEVKCVCAPSGDRLHGSYELCSLALCELWRWRGKQRGRRHSCVRRDGFCVLESMTVVLNNSLIMEAVKSEVKQMTVTYTLMAQCWYTVSIVFLMRLEYSVSCLSSYSVIYKSDLSFSHFTASLVRNLLLCSTFPSGPVCKSSSKIFH